jgi:hypothetical protein
MFLAVCQLALVAAAESVVRHAAYSAVRSAIVVLDDDPKHFGGAALSDPSSGVAHASRLPNTADIMRKLQVFSSIDDGLPEQFNYLAGQGGTRMLPITTAAMLPLLPLAPNRNQVRADADNVASALVSTDEEQLKFSLQYARRYTVVTLHDSETSDVMANRPFSYNAPVTARVRYLFHCTVPLVRMLMCRTLPSRGKSELQDGNAVANIGLVNEEARFKVLTAKATLPNQGAQYYRSN